MAKILIGCRLPNGLILQHPDKEVKERVKLTGLNESRIVGATYVTTEVDADFWDAFKKAHTDYAPLKSGAIFEAANATQAKAKAKDLEDEKTGFEAMEPESHGVKPSSEDGEDEE